MSSNRIFQVHHDYMDTQGNECVEAKRGTEHNIIEYNICTGQKNPNSGGIVSRGNGNIIRYNEIYANVGAGARLGGQLVDGIQYGVDNHVSGNIVYSNEAGGVKILVDSQAKECGNTLWENAAGDVRGTFGENYEPAAPCAAEA